VAEGSGWASPAGDAQPSGPVPFAAPVPVVPGFAPQPPPPPPAGWTQPGAWAPPPKPGLVPLSPMTLGTILGASFRVLRRNPRPIFLISLIVNGITAVVSVLVSGSAVNSLANAFTTLANGSTASTSQINGLLLADFAEFGAVALVYVGTTFMQGIVALEVARGAIGEKLPLRALLRRARNRLLPLLGWSVLVVVAGFVYAVVIVLLIALAIGLAAASGGAGAIAGAVIGTIVLILGGITLAVWIGTKVSLVPSALLIERLTLGKAIARSWRLVKGYFWRTFGIQALVLLIVSIAGSIVETPVELIGSLIVQATHPTGTSAADYKEAFTQLTYITGVVHAVISTVTTIISSSAVALVYLDLRIRKEGLDLALIQYVDARQAGGVAPEDPYGTPVATPIQSMPPMPPMTPTQAAAPATPAAPVPPPPPMMQPPA